MYDKVVSMACFIRPRIPKSNHITSDCSPSLSLSDSPGPLTVLTACKFMSLLKKTLNECHAFFYRIPTRLGPGPQQLIRHVKELVQLIVVVVVVIWGLLTVLGIKMVTPEPDQREQQTHLKMLKLINCAANADRGKEQGQDQGQGRGHSQSQQRFSLG